MIYWDVNLSILKSVGYNRPASGYRYSILGIGGLFSDAYLPLRCTNQRKPFQDGRLSPRSTMVFWFCYGHRFFVRQAQVSLCSVRLPASCRRDSFNPDSSRHLLIGRRPSHRHLRQAVHGTLSSTSSSGMVEWTPGPPAEGGRALPTGWEDDLHSPWIWYIARRTPPGRITGYAPNDNEPLCIFTQEAARKGVAVLQQHIVAVPDAVARVVVHQ